MLRITSFAAIALMTVGLSAPALAGGKSLTEIVAASGGDFDKNGRDYDILLNAVIAADLADALDDPDVSWTLFAPNDWAFIRLARDFGYQGFDEEGAFAAIVDVLTTLGNGNPIPVLTEVLLYHVSPEALGPFQVIFSSKIDTLQGGVIRPFFIILRDNEPDLRNPVLTWPINKKATNGVLHTINRVLIQADL